MKDPFFEEDSNDFDDLYGHPRPSVSTSASRPQSRNNDGSTALRTSINSYTSAYSSVASSSVASKSYARDRTGSWASNVTDVAATGQRGKRRSRHGKPRRKNSEELFDVRWQSDIHESQCNLCRAAFSLVRRKHHCRHCGRVICSDCSSFLFFELSHRRHRVCTSCNDQLLAEQAVYDHDIRSQEPLRSITSEKACPPASKSHQDELVTSLFDHTDEDWFTDVPVRDSEAQEWEKSDSKGPGWRDQVKTTYIVSNVKQTTERGSLPSTLLTAGITGKGYISEQFQYDDIEASGRHDNHEAALAMPRPTQELKAVIDTRHSVGFQQRTGICYDTERSYYDNSGLGFPSDTSATSAVPRPETQLPRDLNSYDRSKLFKDGCGTFDDKRPKERWSQGRYTMNEQSTNDSKVLAQKKERMTVNELDLSYSLEDEIQYRESAMPQFKVAADLSNDYGHDVSQQVVDNGSKMLETTTEDKRDEKQQQQTERETIGAIVSSILAPRFASDHDMDENPSLPSNFPVNTRRNEETKKKNKKGGFTGALKRFFGIKSKSAKQKTMAMAPVVAQSSHAEDFARRNDGAAEPHSNKSDEVHGENFVSCEPEHLNVSTVDGTGIASQKERNFTTKETARFRDLDSHFETSQARKTIHEQHYEEQKRQRRGTFDDLFESPQHSKIGDPHFGVRTSLNGATEWAAARGSENTNAVLNAEKESSVDQRRSFNARDDTTHFDKSQPPKVISRATNDRVEPWRRWAAMSFLIDQKDSSQLKEANFTLSNVKSNPTITYAVPTSFQPQKTRKDDRELNDTPLLPLTAHGTIMDDLNRNSTVTKTMTKDSVDDFFAEFEEPNEYVFDSTMNKYVAARDLRSRAVSRYENEATVFKISSPLAVNGKNLHDSIQHDNEASSVVLRNLPVAPNSVDTEEEVADLIVNKISSLEDELAALKQLIRVRKGGSTYEARTYDTTKSTIYNKSIFNDDSRSDEDIKPNRDVTSSLNLESQQPFSYKKKLKKRVDSFADLFDDDYNEKSTLGGAISYETLFQTGKATEPSKNESSDDDEDISLKKTKLRPTSRRRSSRKIKGFIPSVDSDTELTTLNERRKEQASRFQGSEKGREKHANWTSPPFEKKRIQSLSKDVFQSTSVLGQDEDSIDALFDLSKDRDVAKLFEGDDSHENEVYSDTPEVDASQDLLEESAVLTHALSKSLIDDDSSRPSLSTAASSGFSYGDSQHVGEVNEEEELTIDWSKMRKTRPRRHISRSNTPEFSGGDDKSTEKKVELRLVDANSEPCMEDRNTFLERTQNESDPFASTIERSIDIVTEKTADSFTSDVEDLKSLSPSVTTMKPPKVSTTSATPSRDNYDLYTAPASILIDTMSMSSKLEGIPSKESNDTVMNPWARTSNVKESTKANATDITGENRFDIFDKSHDVDFVSMTSSMDMNKSDQERDSDDEQVDLTTFNDEYVSFEIQTSLNVKRVNESTEMSKKLALIERQDSFQDSSVDETLKLGKYTSSLIPLLRTASIDRNDKDAEVNVSGHDNALLGKVTTETFDMDWQQMQIQEKERKKRLQAKQRQAQRDKAIRKQTIVSKSHANNGTKLNKSTFKKKKKPIQDDALVSSSHHTKNISTRRPRHKINEEHEPLRSLTEL
ncbi:hypothetical protein CCR75_000911 [Bremia lactucae]|uniref:FYVE-type domain-containing protein n=1 Tax=Bremia lactucae TaxID=4779 RepID=A0A976IEN3_BRELC|nr:hypothetical protein CCR75_000911 [Bremia lactucae]